MIKTIDFTIDAFKKLNQEPKKLHYIGDKSLLYKRKVSIVGTRRPSSYTKTFTHKLSNDVIYKNKSNSIIINRTKGIHNA